MDMSLFEFIQYAFLTIIFFIASMAVANVLLTAVGIYLFLEEINYGVCQ